MLVTIEFGLVSKNNSEEWPALNPISRIFLNELYIF